MESLTSTLVHEFMHSKLAGDSASPSAGPIKDVQYGAPGCMRMRQGDLPQRAFVNADSYVWFALNAFYNSHCGRADRPFSEPVITTEEFEASEARLLASPEYDADLASGVLAGV